MKTLQILSAGIIMLMSFSCEKNSDLVIPNSQEGATDEMITRSTTIYPNSLNSKFSRGFGINNAGVITGSVEHPAGTVVAFTLSNQGVWYSTEAVSPNGLPEIRFAINDCGEVAGHKIVPGGISPVMWRGGVTHNLNILPGYKFGEVYAINSSGQMVGESLNGNYVNPSELRATVFSLNDPPIDLGTLGGTKASAAGINDKGEIVGFAETAKVGQTRAFLYKNGIMSDLGTLGGVWSNANAINNKSEIVGRSVLADGISIRGFLYRDGQMINIGTLGGNSSVAVDINERSEIVGFSRISSGQFHAFLYRDGVMTDLGALLDALDSRAMGINNRGDVTGYFTKSDGSVHAFLYQKGIMIQL